MTTSLPEAIALCALEEPRVTSAGNGLEVMEGAFVFPASFPGFDGHFPGNPILPGIAQIMAAAHVAAWGRGGALASVKRCKFMRPVRPGERLRVVVERTQDGQCDAALEVEGAPCASVLFSLGV